MCYCVSSSNSVFLRWSSARVAAYSSCVCTRSLTAMLKVASSSVFTLSVRLYFSLAMSSLRVALRSLRSRDISFLLARSWLMISSLVLMAAIAYSSLLVRYSIISSLFSGRGIASACCSFNFSSLRSASSSSSYAFISSS